MAGGGLDRDQLIERVSGALKVTEAEARALITELAGAQLLQAPNDHRAQVTLTDAGRQLHTRVRAEVTEITERLWGDLPAENLETAGRVLSTVLARANAELARA